MTASITQQNKVNAPVSNEAKLTNAQWQDQDHTWGEANYTWGQPELVLAKESKVTATVSNENKT